MNSLISILDALEDIKLCKYNESLNKIGVKWFSGKRFDYMLLLLPIQRSRTDMIGNK